jgi:23S rRNA (cytidine1920-2'-O)/16S rRNA (cytidine1409-2'-O)-methyltransferase
MAVDVGTKQLYPTLRDNPRVELHEKTDVRDFRPGDQPDIILADVSFVSLREILPHISTFSSAQTQIIVMAKPQFEAGQAGLKHKGVIKNDHMRRDILRAFENWVTRYFIILNKADSAVTGAKGNRERFYLLRRVNS